MFKKLTAIFITVLMMATLLTGCLSSGSKPTNTPPANTGNDPAKGAKVIKVSNGVSESHPSITALREVFKKQVEEKTNGRYTVEVYHTNQLGDDTKATEAVKAGTIEANMTSTAPLVGLVPELAIFDIPFLFPNEKVADAILDGEIGKMLADKMPAQGIITLAWAENGFRHLTNSVRAVRTPADLKGMKVRTMDNKFHLAAWTAMGASPTPMSWSEVFTALQSKTIDGQENPIPNSYSARIQEVNKHFTLSGHIYSPFMFNFSKKVWDTIPAADQKIIREAAIATGKRERELNREATVKNLGQLKNEGVTVTELTAAEKKVFQDLTLPVWNQVAEKAGKDLVEKLKSEIAKVAK
jgi:TRAP-type transport system periplasmic protein